MNEFFKVVPRRLSFLSTITAVQLLLLAGSLTQHKVVTGNQPQTPTEYHITFLCFSPKP